MQTLANARRLPVVLGVLAALTLLSATAASAQVRGREAAALPDRVTNSPELSAVVFSGAQKAFVQIQFDRGIVTAVDRNARTITIVQRQAGHIWRTQSFTVPAGTDIVIGGHAQPLRKLRVGMHVRIEQTALLGASLAVVRVDAQGGVRDEPLPPTTAGGSLPGATSGTAGGASAGNKDNQHPHFLPARFSDAPELGAVVFSPASGTSSNSFIELLFDRGKITATSRTAGDTITIVQRQGGHVWRTQTFAIPPSAKIVTQRNSAGGPVKLTVGMHVRIEQAGPIGGPLEVVRVDVRASRDVAFPTAG